MDPAHRDMAHLRVVAPAPFGELLRAYRLAAGFTQEKLAERAGLSVQGLRALENGRRQAPYRSTVAMLTRALGLTTTEAAALEAAVVRGRVPPAVTAAGPPVLPKHEAGMVPAVEQGPATAPTGRALEAAALPTGTLTFLLTDIEGSATFWEQHPAAMQRAIVRHDTLIEEVLARYGGRQVKERGEGDSVLAVFTSPSAALAAVCALQQALHAEPWPLETPLRVRMGLHTGEAELRGASYYGATVNRAARIRALAHGGQVLLSQATHDLVRDGLPEEVSLRSLGVHGLKGLQRPEEVYQLLHPSLPAEFPPLLSQRVPRTNLPAPLTQLIGREREQAEVAALLENARLVTLTGTGGVGKTRLVLEVARAKPPAYEDGVWLVELAPLADPSLVPMAIAGVLGVLEEPGRLLAETLVSYLGAKRLLLVLDNCEHLVEACAGLAARLLAACPGLRILATSRAPLRVRGESAFPLEPFPIPDLTASLSPAALAGNPAIALFGQRAHASDPTFALTAANAPVAAEICARLDGLPLAIELAAARVRLLPLPALLARLGQRLPLLVGRDRDLPERHRTMRGAIAWSYELLEPAERMLLRRLATFHGGGTLEAITSICVPDATEDEVLLWLETLVEQSLVRRQQGDEPRYRMLETIREYGLECLEASGQAGDVRRAHTLYFLALAETAEPALWGSEQATWLERLEWDLDNLRAALRWAAEAGELELGLRLASALCRFWRARGRAHEGYAILSELLARQRSGHDQDDAAAMGVAATVRARALSGAGTLADLAGQFTQATTLLEESVALFRGLGDRSGLAGALTSLGAARYKQGEHAQATVFLEEGLALYRDLGDRQQLPEALHNLGMVLLSQGDYERAALLMEESMRLYQALGNMFGYTRALRGLGGVVRAQGNLERAIALQEESLAVARQLGDTLGVAQQLQNLGRLAYLQGDLEHARALYAEGLALPWDKRDLWGVAFYLEGVAGVTAALGHAAQAAQLLGAAEVLREAAHAPQQAYERDFYEQAVARVRATLDQQTYAARWAEGRALPVEQAVAAALELVQPGSQPEHTTRQTC